MATGSLLGPTEWLKREGPLQPFRAPLMRIDILSGPSTARQVRLPGPQIRIGSAPGCDLVIEDRAVSRHHVTLRVQDDGLRVQDEGSTNGTTIDGLRIRDAFARPDSRIVIGSTTLRLAMLADEIDLPISPRERFGPLLGHSPAMRLAFATLERAAACGTTLLIEGETGTGKELAAEGVHEEGLRATGPFVVFDCSAVSANLIESELFGHVRGAFTGAVCDRMGAFECADGGTIFLDEVGELPIDLQPKLLRVLEKREVRRVGSSQTTKVDVRIIAATHRSLDREIERGRFREDLFYRLAVLKVRLPPLRERIDDLPLLIDRFVSDLTGHRQPALCDQLVDSLRDNTFPGNVRELRNAVTRTLALLDPRTAAPVPTTGPIPDAATIDTNLPLRVGRSRLIAQYEAGYLRAILARTGGNISRAADLAGVNRRFIQRAAKLYGLSNTDDSLK